MLFIIFAWIYAIDTFPRGSKLPQTSVPAAYHNINDCGWLKTLSSGCVHENIMLRLETKFRHWICQPQTASIKTQEEQWNHGHCTNTGLGCKAHFVSNGLAPLSHSRKSDVCDPFPHRRRYNKHWGFFLTYTVLGRNQWRSRQQHGRSLSTPRRQRESPDRHRSRTR